MAIVQFVEVKPFTSCCKDLEIMYHIPSSIPSNSRHYIALCEVGESSEFTWVWAGRIVPLQEEGITVKCRKGKVTFACQVLPKLSDGREYYLMYCNEDGTILGESRPFQFFTDSDEFSSIDLQSAPSDDVVMVSMHHKKAPLTTGLEVSLHNNDDDDTTSFEVLSEQRYTDTTEPLAGGFSQFFADSDEFSSIGLQSTPNSNMVMDSMHRNMDPLSTSTSESSLLLSKQRYLDTAAEIEEKQSPMQNQLWESDTEKEAIQQLRSEVARSEESFIEDLQAEIATLKEQVALNTLSNSTVLINSPKEDKEKRILKKRIQEETKKSARLEELLDHKETKIARVENEKAELTAELRKMEQKIHTLQIENKRLIDQQTRALAQKDLCRGANKKHEVLIDNFGKICSTLVDIDELIPEFISKRMITVNIGTKIRNGCTLKEKVHIFLEHIADPIIHNGEVFDNLLCILEESKLSGPQLAKDMRDQLTAKRLSHLKLNCGDLKDEPQFKQLILEAEHQISLRSTNEDCEKSYKATGDYTAEEDDEISCLEGDTILCEKVPGLNKRTGKRGKIPLCFVQKLKPIP